MRVLMLSWEFPPHIIGGLGRHVADIAPALTNHNIDLHLVTPWLGEAPEQEQLAKGLTVHRVAVPDNVNDRADLVAAIQRGNLSLAQAGMRLHNQLGSFDLIHGHDWLVASSSVALKYALNRPLVTTIHSLECGRMQGTLASEQSMAINGIECWAVQEADQVITVSNYMAQQLQKTFAVSSSKIDVVYNGVTPRTPLALSQQQRAEIRRLYAAPHERLVCYVGRLVYEKGVQTLIEAVLCIRKEIPNIKVVIAGTGPMQDQLRQQAKACGVEHDVIFAGYISDEERDQLLTVADAAVFPSLYEPFGIVALEAMSYGCPVVVSATGGLAEIVRPHETGIVTQPGNADSLAWGIVHTLQRPDWAAARASNATHDLGTLYSWERIAGQTTDSYRQAVVSWRGGWKKTQERAEQNAFMPRFPSVAIPALLPAINQ